MMAHLHKALSLALLLFATQAAIAEEKPTNLADARAAIEKNLNTPEGKRFDDQMGTEFVSKHLVPLAAVQTDYE
jgi:hypothetical protein